MSLSSASSFNFYTVLRLVGGGAGGRHRACPRAQEVLSIGLELLVAPQLRTGFLLNIFELFCTCCSAASATLVTHAPIVSQQSLSYL